MQENVVPRDNGLLSNVFWLKTCVMAVALSAWMGFVVFSSKQETWAIVVNVIVLVVVVVLHAAVFLVHDPSERFMRSEAERYHAAMQEARTTVARLRQKLQSTKQDTN